MKEGQIMEIQNSMIAVLGDAMLDRYISGKVSRVSPEAPIPVVNAHEDRDVLGGAANVIRNLCDFGGKARLISVIGKESPETQSFMDCLGRHDCEQSSLIIDPSRPTTSKTRVLGNGQQIVRIDREVSEPISAEIEEKLCNELRICFRKNDRAMQALIVADYAKGVITPKIVSELHELARSGVLVSVDPHPKNHQNWSGVSVFKPNLSELETITGVSIEILKGEDPRENTSLRRAMDILYEEYGNEHLLITLSEHGMVYAHENEELFWEPTRAREVFDVSGAGDTVISYFTMALAAGWSGVKATQLANVAAGLVVQKLGTASLSYEEVNREWTRMNKNKR